MPGGTLLFFVRTEVVEDGSVELASFWIVQDLLQVGCAHEQPALFDRYFIKQSQFMVPFYIVYHLDDGRYAVQSVKNHGMGFLDDREPLPVGVFPCRELLEQRMSRIGQYSQSTGRHRLANHNPRSSRRYPS